MPVCRGANPEPYWLIIRLRRCLATWALVAARGVPVRKVLRQRGRSIATDRPAPSPAIAGALLLARLSSGLLPKIRLLTARDSLGTVRGAYPVSAAKPEKYSK